MSAEADRSASILIVGAGPAGIAAAAVCGERALWVDESGLPGGQIWRGGRPVDALSRKWLAQVARPPRQGRVVDLRPGYALLETPEGPERITFEKLILATGARELFLPFPGWTLPGVFGAGGLQALVKSGMPVEGKRVVVAGSGPLLLAVAAYLRGRGARVVAVLEQAPRARLSRFLLRHPGKIWQGMKLAFGLPYRTSVWVTRFTGDAVECSSGRTIACDYLATGYGLVPNTDLWTPFPLDQPDVFVAGEMCGVGGVEKALLEGEIAGMRALGADPEGLMPEYRRALGFARDLEWAFALRPELRALPADDTMVCRCEDVPYREVRRWQSWREAKLQSRCGMGPCQGRVCGPANAFLLGWPLPAPRPPYTAASIETLIHFDEVS
jgi:thioredoxin reductase